MYTSGRTVKSSKPARSPIQVATATARRLVKKHLPAHAYPVISSKHVTGADGVTRMKTEILFVELPHEVTKPLADAIEALPGYSTMCWNLVSISYFVALED